MKRCPQCAYTYADSDGFCVMDGSPLIDDTLSYEPLPHQIPHNQIPHTGKLQNELRLLDQYNS
ncbi:MAG: hypothetical protein ACREEM_24125, partial [Blastocatellia bacterium]